MKKVTAFFTALLFFPALVIGYLAACAKPGFDTGREIAEES